MKTREVSKVLYTLARLLDTCPNMEIDQAIGRVEKAPKNKQMSSEALVVNISTLLKLSAIDKQQWLDFAKSNGISLELRPRDASRDVLGKIFKYLENNPEALAKIERRVESVSPTISVELANALRLLMRR